MCVCVCEKEGEGGGSEVLNCFYYCSFRIFQGSAPAKGSLIIPSIVERLHERQYSIRPFKHCDHMCLGYLQGYLKRISNWLVRCHVFFSPE